MSEFLPPVLFEIKAKATEAIASFEKVNLELKKMDANGTLAGAGIKKAEMAAKYARVAVLGLVGAFGVLAVDSVKKTISAQEAMTKLEVAVKNTGVSFEDAKPYIEDAQTSMRNLGFTGTDTAEALAKMTAASGSPKLALDALGVAADLARAKNMSLADAGVLVARASIGQAKGLGDLGIAIGKTIPKGASMAQIFKAIEDRFGGLAQKSKNDLSVQLQVLRANFSAMEVQLGKALIPALSNVVNFVTNTFLPKLKDVGDWFSKHKTLVTEFGVALGTIWATSKIVGFISMLTKVAEAFRAIAVASGIAAIAEGFATGGISIAASSAAMLPFLEVLGLSAAGFLAVAAGKKELSAGSSTSFTTPMSISGQSKITPSLAGKGVSKVSPKPTPKPSPTVNQNVTVYASNTNDISKKLSKAAVNGVPLGGK